MVLTAIGVCLGVVGIAFIVLASKVDPLGSLDPNKPGMKLTLIGVIFGLLGIVATTFGLISITAHLFIGIAAFVIGGAIFCVSLFPIDDNRGGGWKNTVSLVGVVIGLLILSASGPLLIGSFWGWLVSI